MKDTLIVFLALSAFFLSCKKPSSTTEEPSEKYLSITANNTWNYQQTNNAGTTPIVSNYTLTSTSKDTSINSKSYHIFNLSTGGKQYVNISGNDYYQYDSLSFAGTAFAVERLYLKDNAAVNTNWTQNVNVSVPGLPIAVPITLNNTITEKGISRTLNNVTYTNVIHVQTITTSLVIPAGSFNTTINSYYAPKYGLIENTTVGILNYAGFNQNINTKLILMSANIK
jgi:hypothetical protein